MRFRARGEKSDLMVGTSLTWKCRAQQSPSGLLYISRSSLTAPMRLRRYHNTAAACRSCPARRTSHFPRCNINLRLSRLAEASLAHRIRGPVYARPSPSAGGLMQRQSLLTCEFVRSCCQCSQNALVCDFRYHIREACSRSESAVNAETIMVARS
jgi:hypothetical protein